MAIHGIQSLMNIYTNNVVRDKKLRESAGIFTKASSMFEPVTDEGDYHIWRATA